MPRVTAQVVPRLLPYLEAGLAPGASAEQYAGALMVACQLASVAALAAPLTEALLEGVAKGARAPLHAQSLQASLALCQTQGVTTLPTRAFKHLVKLPDLPGHLADLCRGYRADSLTVPLVVALAESASAHQNYERVLVGVVTEAPLSAVAVTALVAALVRGGGGLGGGGVGGKRLGVYSFEDSAAGGNTVPRTHVECGGCFAGERAR
jgi:U3 small nucleolar RNA-associated protein 10